MIDWTTIIYGAALSAIVTAIVVAVAARGSRLPAALVAAAGAFPGQRPISFHPTRP